MKYPTNRKRVLCVRKALRERAEERSKLFLRFDAAEADLDRLADARLEHARSRPPDRFRRKLADWVWHGNDLAQKTWYAEQALAAAVRAVEEHDRHPETGRLAWMLRELLKQRRRMDRNRRVVQLKLPFF